jgi:hypothetical protein
MSYACHFNHRRSLLPRDFSKLFIRKNRLHELVAVVDILERKSLSSSAYHMMVRKKTGITQPGGLGQCAAAVLAARRD